MESFGFIGPTYTSRSISADCQRTINFYPEEVESGAGKSRWVLYGTPGLRKIGELPNGPVRALYSGDGERVFAVGGPMLYEVNRDGTSRELGVVGPGVMPAQIASNGRQLFIASGGRGYIADGQRVFQVTDAAMGAYLDGYFIALKPASGRFAISALLDGTSWDALDFATAEAQPDHAVSMLVAHRELWIFGQQTTEVFGNTGNADFPFERIGAGYIEQGCAARYSPVALENGIYWLGGDSRGGGVVWRASGYTPQRVSNHAVEAAMSRYEWIDDAIGFGYVDGGHAYYVLYFPSADKTWVYDATTGLWHERSWWDVVHGAHRAHRAQCHCYAWGKHLVGDRETGAIYELSHTAYDDDGNPIRRERIAPHIASRGKVLFYSAMQLDMEVGIGADGDGQGADPQVSLQWSDDAGKTWSNERWVSAGRIGEYKRRVIWRRLGRARDRVFRVSISDPVPVALIDAYVDVIPGTN